MSRPNDENGPDKSSESTPRPSVEFTNNELTEVVIPSDIIRGRDASGDDSANRIFRAKDDAPTPKKQ
jgi:hypothetical protein